MIISVDKFFMNSWLLDCQFCECTYIPLVAGMYYHRMYMFMPMVLKRLNKIVNNDKNINNKIFKFYVGYYNPSLLVKDFCKVNQAKNEKVVNLANDALVDLREDLTKKTIPNPMRIPRPYINILYLHKRATKGVYIPPQNWQSGNHELIKNFQFNHKGRI